MQGEDDHPRSSVRTRGVPRIHLVKVGAVASLPRGKGELGAARGCGWPCDLHPARALGCGSRVASAACPVSKWPMVQDPLDAFDKLAEVTDSPSTTSSDPSRLEPRLQSPDQFACRALLPYLLAHSDLKR